MTTENDSKAVPLSGKLDAQSKQDFVADAEVNGCATAAQEKKL